MTKRLAAAWTAAYGAVHVWWAVAGAPAFGSFGESFIPGEWPPVVLAALAATACLLPVSRAAVTLGWAAGVGLIGYSFMFALDIVGLLFGNALDVAGFLIRGAGVAGGVLTVLCAVAARRRVAGACPRCGRLHGRSPESRTEPSPRWAFAAAYVAVTGAVARIAAQLGEWPWGTGDPAGPIFLALYALAGTLLPLALVHRWGRIWPGWVPVVAGRAVPRWVVLVPAFLVGGGLAGYFGIAGLTLMVTEGTGQPLWWTLTVIPGYTVWGLGLLVAATSYIIMTKPPCVRACAPA
ncbi:hypothetical protein [Nonomuraea sp. SBT364]|uniref:hypothetical protein n=1 Tax=Nonomuraea sp. SBT364 TaxID=1580530 RepID=UPI00066B9936|nr:hypothetical protein [Nonomuraea sp. SBT364]